MTRISTCLSHAARLARALACTTLLGGGLGAAAAAELVISVEPAGSDGTVVMALYNSAADFRDRPLFERSQIASASPVRFRFDQLPAGHYAVAIYQDTNSNGKLDTNLLGIPREPYGFSQEPKGLMRPPTWEQVRFELPPSGTAIRVQLAK